MALGILMAIDMGLEATWAADRDRCLAAFHAAVDAAKAGRFGLGRALIERVQARGGARMAEVARRELRKHAGLPLDAPVDAEASA